MLKDDDRDHTRAHERAAPMRAARSGPLEGLRILDVTQAIAGPWASMMFADLGADVIKIEPPGGEGQRYLTPFTKDDEVRAYGGAYGSYNRNKRSIVLDLRDPGDKLVFLRLVDSADAVIENSRAGVMDRLGLGWETLHERNPRLVYGAVRGFGDPRTGASPYADWPAYDVIAQAMGSFVSMNGPGEGEETKGGPFIGDIFPGTVTAMAVLAALYHARETGIGQFVDVSMVDAVTALCDLGVIRHTYLGRPTPPSGNRSDFQVPFDIFPTADGRCAIAAPTDHHFALLGELIGHPEWAHDPRFRLNKDRVKNRAEIDLAVQEWAAAHTNAEIVAILGGRIPVGPVNRPADLFEDPHVAAREMLVAVDQPSGRPVVLVNTPMKFTGTPVGIYRRAPMLDEHGAEIRAELDARDAAG